MLAGCRGAGLLFVAPGFQSIGSGCGAGAVDDVGRGGVWVGGGAGTESKYVAGAGVLSGFELVFGAALGLLALIPIAALQGGLVSGQQIGVCHVVRPQRWRRGGPRVGSWPVGLGLFVVLGVPEALSGVREGMTRFPPRVMLDVGLMTRPFQPC